MSVILELDDRTVFACILLVAIVFTALFLTLHRRYPDIKGPRYFAIAFAGLIPLAITIVFSAVLPLHLTIFVGTFFLCVFDLFVYIGLLRFLGRQRPLLPALFIAAALITLTMYFTEAHDSAVLRVAVRWLADASFHALIAGELFVGSKSKLRSGFAAFIGIEALVGLARTLSVLILRDSANMSAHNSIRTVYVLTELLFVVLLGTFLLAMVFSRVKNFIERRAQRDRLTGTLNRGGFDDLLQSEWQSLRGQCSLLLIDIDNFKGVNDSLGHLAGDLALKHVAMHIGNQLRSLDKIGRYGGDEFVIILPQTALGEAVLIAERIRESIEASAGLKQICVESVSVGVAEVHEHDDTNSLLGRADDALYVAKRAGRNCVRCSTAEVSEAVLASEGADKRNVAARYKAPFLQNELSI